MGTSHTLCCLCMCSHNKRQETQECSLWSDRQIYIHFAWAVYLLPGPDLSCQSLPMAECAGNPLASVVLTDIPKLC